MTVVGKGKIPVLAFQVKLRPGVPIYEQVAQAIRRAIARGDLKAGDALPSVRELSRELQINPNTAQKVMSQLTAEKLVEVHPGIGSVVAERAHLAKETLDQLLENKLVPIVEEAVGFGISQEQLLSAVKEIYRKLLKDKNE